MPELPAARPVQQRPALWAEIAARYERALGERLTGVAAFGSRARGSAREDSDHDILLVAAGLPATPFERAREIRAPLRGLHRENIQVLARTPQAFLADVTPLHLDLALDAIVLAERDAFLTTHLARLRELIDQAGLHRDRNLFWHWKQPPRKDWAITWDGAHV